jgi:hypothetical protein
MAEHFNQATCGAELGIGDPGQGLTGLTGLKIEGNKHQSNNHLMLYPLIFPCFSEIAALFL